MIHVNITLINIDQDSLVLNFHGRVTLPSTKNLQIIEGSNNERESATAEVLLQFGKSNADEFIVDFQYPFCPLQAFAICLSSLDNKIGLK